MKDQFIQSLQLILAPHDLHIHDFKSGSINNQFIGHAFPRTTEQLDLLVNLAQTYKVAISFVNPSKINHQNKIHKAQFIIGLKYLTSTYEVDVHNGEIVIERRMSPSLKTRAA